MLAYLALAASAALAQFNGTNATVTSDVTVFTTYCPEPTTFAYGNSTYTVTEATTLTLTSCACTAEPVSNATHASNGTAVPPANAAPAVGAVGVAAIAGIAAFVL